jgi:hypothetical protein
LLCAQRRFPATVFVFDAVTATRLAQMFAQQLAGLGIQQPDMPAVHRPGNALIQGASVSP